MSYTAKTIEWVIEQINQKKIVLPAIQRKFVWRPEQIVSLFDSLLQGYPIGTFLFWNMDKVNHINDYSFYEFMLHYNEFDHYENDKVPMPLIKPNATGYYGVLDGQQRLSALYLALQGTYAYKIPHCRRQDKRSYPARSLYFNILSPKMPESENGLAYQLSFKLPEEVAKDNKEFWYDVRDILTWGDDVEQVIDAKTEELFSGITLSNEQVIIAKLNLRNLWSKIFSEDVINFFTLKSNELDEVLEIFVRVNSGGTILSKSDLLVSTIIANWQEARAEFDNFLKEINAHYYFRFNNDVLMKTCLFLIDGDIQFKVKNFNKTIVEQIKNNWINIKAAIEKTKKLLLEFGFSDENLTSYNATIPISYFIYKGGDVQKEKEDIKKYLVIALCKQLFGGSSDTVLSEFREILKANNSIKSLMISDKLKHNRNFEVSDEFIEDLFTKKKGAYTFMVLSLLYPNIKYSEITFHQDHMHPSCLFNSKYFRDNDISEAKLNDWINLKDSIPNLQILEGLANSEKLKTPFDKWVATKYKREDALKNYLIQNYIDESVSLNIADFEEFYNKRKLKLVGKLKEILGINS